MRLVVTQRNYDAVNTRTGGTGGVVGMDTYRERLLKYVPVEGLVLFVAIYGGTYAVLGLQPYFPLLARWILLGCIAATLLWLWKVEGVDDVIQLAISCIGLVVWVFAFGVVPVAELPWFNQVAAAVFLPLYVFCTPLIGGRPERW